MAVLGHERDGAVAVRDVLVAVRLLDDGVRQGHPEAELVQALAQDVRVRVLRWRWRWGRRRVCVRYNRAIKCGNRRGVNRRSMNTNTATKIRTGIVESRRREMKTSMCG